MDSILCLCVSRSKNATKEERWSTMYVGGLLVTCRKVTELCKSPRSISCFLVRDIISTCGCLSFLRINLLLERSKNSQCRLILIRQLITMKTVGNRILLCTICWIEQTAKKKLPISFMHSPPSHFYGFDSMSFAYSVKKVFKFESSVWSWNAEMTHVANSWFLQRFKTCVYFLVFSFSFSFERRFRQKRYL